MSFRPFTSESYPQDDRPEAWRDVLSAAGLKPAPASANTADGGHATASHRQAPGVALTRIAASAQGISPLLLPNEDLPVALLPVEDGVVLASRTGHRIIPAGRLLLLPRHGDCSVLFQPAMRAVVLSVTSDALHGRIAARPRLAEPHVVAPGGFADVFARTLEASARVLETLDDAEWATLA
nr:hypothetical protein [Bradyrhizobium sp.]